MTKNSNFCRFFSRDDNKRNMMQLTNKKLNKIQASYTLEGTVLENVDNYGVPAGSKVHF